ncbi:lamin tail domain-containing protein [Calidifontibacter indicus]|uniref:lamin tail domain-containing protein n=1 Tax=Calidifontibacter indicus TaxID=419650 RepID=UPI003D71F427
MPSSPLFRIAAAASGASIAFSVALAMAPSAQAASTSVVISEAYGGGGNSGATYKSDFVELYNLSNTTVDLTGWKVQYWSAAGVTPQSTSLTGSVAPGTSFLVKEADGANASATPLPTPDVTGTIAMSGTAARVAIVNPAGEVVDLAGWGSGVATFEGAPAAGTTNATSVARISPCTDTDNNAKDFAVGAPTPRNSAAGPQDCTPTDPGDPGEPGGQSATVAQIQGASHTSPLVGKDVKNVEGIVTATKSTGVWIQSTTPDDDPATSEGLFVFTRTAPTVQVGDKVKLAGKVAEFRPGGSGGTTNLTTTELDSPSIEVVASGQPLPAPVVIGVDRIAPQQTVFDGNPGNVETPGTAFDPTRNALDSDESLEGMRVALRDARAVGPTATAYGETPVVPGQNVSAINSPRGGVVYGSYNTPNSMRLILNDSLVKGQIRAAQTGDTYPGLTVGIIDYAFANYNLYATQSNQLKSGGLTREVTAASGGNEMAVATFNVENLAPSDPATKYVRLAGQIVTNLKAPDILALEEIQDNSGATNDGVTDSTVTSDKLIAAIKAAGGPSYQAKWVNPTNGTDGGQPGGNIRQVFLYRSGGDLSFVDKPGATATTATDVVGTGRNTSLTYSPGRIDPANGAWASSRKPLVGQFTWKGRSVFVIANHFASKGGDDPLMGRFQQPLRSSETQRANQATAVRTFVDKLLAADANANVIVLGDINDFEFSKTADILVGSGSTALTDLPRTLPASERYTYVYQGNSQVLDHILLSPNLVRTMANKKYSYDIVHTNSEFSDQDSDHEPQVVRLPVQVTR